MTRAAFGQRAGLGVARVGLGVPYHQAESSRPSIALRLLRAQLSQK
ncbi:hypothetical protein SAMN02787118_107171 [Streptomyces mirabilis]|jgi:hypothetical protein|uniref:Uncharacterized protein n=1 Tax=Streptomyces mirabilis TaxID=68239 RepID=A0A1I2J5E9_9ACTN|nr:hypothetical protein SAMN02787118_107171 [Streptomyces mirabilis]